MGQQLLLNIHLREDASFDNFYIGDNQALLRALTTFIGEPEDRSSDLFYIWGPAHSGRTHLLHAVCQALRRRFGPTAALYIPLADYREYDLHLWQDLERYPLVCIDDLDACCGNTEWEHALFHFYNRSREAGQRLLVTASLPPRQLSIKLNDLQSRLQWGYVYQLHPLSDDALAPALLQHARCRGMVLSSDVIQLLIRTLPHNMAVLTEALAMLDRESLALKRRLTVPFVRQLLSTLTHLESHPNAS